MEDDLGLRLPLRLHPAEGAVAEPGRDPLQEVAGEAPAAAADRPRPRHLPAERRRRVAAAVGAVVLVAGGAAAGSGVVLPAAGAGGVVELGRFPAEEGPEATPEAGAVVGAEVAGDSDGAAAFEDEGGAGVGGDDLLLLVGEEGDLGSAAQMGCGVVGRCCKSSESSCGVGS